MEPVSVMQSIGLSDAQTQSLVRKAEKNIREVGGRRHVEQFVKSLDDIIAEKESHYIPRYKNMSVEGDNKLYNKCMDVLNALHCRWFGSAYGVTHSEVRDLKERIKRGETSFTRFRKEFNDSCLRQTLGLSENDPLPQTKKRRTKLSEYTTEELEAELERRKAV
jgi:hypothetical protein